MDPVGRKRWAIAEGYIPSRSSFVERVLISHETACILNVTDRDAHIANTVFFTNREPVGPYHVTVAARRTLHLRFNDLSDAERSRATPTTPRYSSPMNRLSYSTQEWILAMPKSHCYRRWHLLPTSKIPVNNNKIKTVAISQISVLSSLEP
jgi:hypothetical protein